MKNFNVNKRGKRNAVVCTNEGGARGLNKIINLRPHGHRVIIERAHRQCGARLRETGTRRTKGRVGVRAELYVLKLQLANNGFGMLVAKGSSSSLSLSPGTSMYVRN